MNPPTRSRSILIAGNWKMNSSLQETEKFFSEFKNYTDRVFNDQEISHLKSQALQACIFPSFTSLLKAPLPLSFPVHIGAQNAHWEKKGSFTGEISGPMLKEVGIQWVLVGHSERRQFFGETNLTVQKRTESLLKQGFHVILCIGESREERESGKTKEILSQQIQSIPDISAISDPHLILAYEPVWAIGTGVAASQEQIIETHQNIRCLLSEKIGANLAETTPLLYGGSVTPDNITSLLQCPHVDGALVGGASLQPESFASLLRAGSKSLLFS